MAGKEEDNTAKGCLEVFTEHYSTLMDALPVETLIAKFVSAKVVTFAQQDAILAKETPQEKTRTFLRHIVTHLETSKIHTFQNMLEVVEEHGGSYSYLARDVYKDLLARSINLKASKDETDSSSSASSKGTFTFFIHLEIIKCMQIFWKKV